MDGKGEAPLERGSDLVAFANQARELVVLRDVVVDAATVGAGLWFSYVFVLLYLFIAVAGVTHRNLFFEDPVKLPFLNVDLPIVSFFLFGPVLFLIVHTYVLISSCFVRRKSRHISLRIASPGHGPKNACAIAMAVAKQSFCAGYCRGTRGSYRRNRQVDVGHRTNQSRCRPSGVAR